MKPMPLAEALDTIRKVYEEGKQLYKTLDKGGRDTADARGGSTAKNEEESDMDIEEREIRDFIINSLMICSHIKLRHSFSIDAQTCKLMDIHIQNANKFLDKVRGIRKEAATAIMAEVGRDTKGIV